MRCCAKSTRCSTSLSGAIPDAIDREALAAWWNRIRRWRCKHGLDHDQRHRGDSPLLPQQVVQAVYRATSGDAYVTSDVGQHQMFAAQYYKFDKPRRWINSGGLGTMGFGLPAAMGVQFAYPDATVVCITGEGSFMMNMQELSTCMQYALPIKIINLNNAALGMVKQWQDMQYGGRLSHSTYRDALPDFVEAGGLVRARGFPRRQPGGARGGDGRSVQPEVLGQAGVWSTPASTRTSTSIRWRSRAGT